jgi:CRP/FNR family transcriptional regulator, cyclic AMP receptor protein
MLHVPQVPGPKMDGQGQNHRSEGLSIFPIFRSLDAEALAALVERCTQRRYRRDEWIVPLNEVNADVFFIQSGAVRLQMEKSSDREVIFKDYQARDFFGGVSVIHGKPRKAGVLALTDVTVTRMPGAVFRELLHTVPDVCDHFLLRMAGEIQHLVNRVNEFSTLDVRHRIYAELLRLSRPKAGIEHGAVISPPPRQVDIAARIGTRREPVAREMKVLERAGLLRRNRGALEIVDTRRLQSLLDKVEPHL